ncbi:MAG: PDZ domain-containing protein [Pirellulales bacterium]|nr:PDZ domain-containing protein [Pirellulales bacterium]
MNSSVRGMLVLVCVSFSARSAAAETLEQLEQQAFRAAIAAVQDSVVQVHAVGGLDRVGKTLLAQGPTTGLIVSADGYIVSSAFNFAAQPSSILVRLPDGSQAPAELIARDKNRMLVLLKVETQTPLPAPVAVSGDEIRVGQWSIALGRTFRADQVGVSTGIISGLNRMYGRVVQTDASVSVANYGGPLVDLRGRVFGILVPMSPEAGGQGTASEVAGAEFYDSGIGFAVPLEDVLEILPRWRQGEDLLPGKLGVSLEAGKPHLLPPKITSVWPNSPAARAGWLPEDLILVIDGVAIETQAQLRFQLTPRYAGDRLAVTLRRGDEQLETSITLADQLEPFEHAFLGVLPARKKNSEDATGVLLRGVWPGSPAEQVGLQAGDRLLKINTSKLSELGEAVKELNQFHPNDAVELTVQRQDQELILSAKLQALPEEILAGSDLPVATVLEESRQPHDLFEVLKLPTLAREARFYAPDFDRDQRAGLLVWLGDGSQQQDQWLLTTWQETCRRDRLVLVVAHPEEESGWKAADLKYLERLASTASRRFSSDANRTVIGGSAKAGQLALALALKQPNVFSGAIGIDAPLPRTLKIPETSPNHRLAILAVESQNSPFAPIIRRDLQQLREARYPASWLQRRPAHAKEESLDHSTQATIARWIDALDRF